MNHISFELHDNILAAEDFIRLKVSTGFLDRPFDQVTKAIKNGLFNVTAVCEGKVVGMGRLVGDGALYWYLQEIIVLTEYQGKGIGRSIVHRLLEYIERSSVPGTNISVGLTAVAGKETFYEKFGFSCHSGGMTMNLTVADTVE